MIIPKQFPFRRTIRRLYFNSLMKDNDRYKAYCKHYNLKPEFFVGIGSICEGSGQIIAGKDSYINHYTTLKAVGNDYIYIGDNVRIGPYVYISTENADRSKTRDVHIGSGCFIGAHSFIREGVVIGKNTIIGAGSIVTKGMPANSICFGNPCKPIKSRNV